MLKAFIIAGILWVPIWLHAQSSAGDCACCSSGHRQFDFWVGSWQVTDSVGNPLGENRIEKIQSGCVLMENWTSPQMTGTSYNYYDQSDSTWNQLWLDNQGSQLKLKGRFVDGTMVMKSGLAQGKKGKYYNQISWKENPDGTVTQTWEVFDPEGKVIALLFEGIYAKE